MLVNSALVCLSPCPLVPCLWSARHLKAPNRTTVRLENHFWQQIEVVAQSKGLDWRQWAEKTISVKPSGVNSASWLRVNCLLSAIKSHPTPVI
jgi:predicted DNA-binding ribbon-helix-helix protein